MAGKLLPGIFALLVWFGAAFPLPGLANASVAASSSSSSSAKSSCKEEELLAQAKVTDADFVFGVLSVMSSSELEKLSFNNRNALGGCQSPTGTEVFEKFRLGRDLSSVEQAALMAALTADDVLALEKKQMAFCGDVSPQIHTIGWQPLLVFEDKDGVRPAQNERSARIQVQGLDLYPMCVRVDVQLTGTVPVSRDPSRKIPGTDRADSSADFYTNYPEADRSTSLNIVLLKPYLDRVKTGDKLTVIVQVTPRAILRGTDKEKKRKPVFFARRTFTLYSTEDYRQVLAQRIQPENFVAFPLPDEEAKVLFGSYVRDNYYVVQLSVRNTATDSKVISTGMIRANGTAVILPGSCKPGEAFQVGFTGGGQDNGGAYSAGPTLADNCTEGGYSVPLVVAPQSLQQVYKAMTTKEQFLTRAWVFRSLEFGGAVASGLSGVVNLGTQAVKGIGLFTGVGLPEGKKLWPDTLGDHQENLVNFGMPELIKVAPNAVVDNRFLFFPKKDIVGALADPARADLGSASRVKLVEVRFDDLDIRYETVAAIGSAEMRAEAFSTVLALDAQIASLERNKTWITSGGATGVSYGELDAAGYRGVTKITYGDTAVSDSVTAHAKALDPVAANRSNLYMDLYGDDSDYSEKGLQKAQEILKVLSLSINAGAADEAAQAKVKSIRTQVVTSQAIQDHYLRVAATLQKIYKAYSTSSPTADQTAQIGEWLKVLDDARPVQARGITP